jgi:NAD+-dependent secondary alcohol dehydrogenase Adh1
MLTHTWDASDYARNSAQQQVWARELLAKLDLSSGEAVLDVGCGDGKVTAELAAPGRVVGVDTSAEMVELAVARSDAPGSPLHRSPAIPERVDSCPRGPGGRSRRRNVKAARLHAYGDDMLHLDDVPDPTIDGPHDVIVRIGGAGVCRTDLHVMEGLWRGIQDPRLPYTLGHENAGWVEEVGSSVTTLRTGDAVIVHPLKTDGVCPACRRGDDMHCDQSEFPGLNVDGGFAQYLKTVERSAIKLDEGLAPADIAPYADAGLTAYRAVKKAVALLPPGARCVVIGIGGLGHIGLQCLRAMTGAEIVALDASDEALQMAARLGADAVVKAGDDAVARVRELSHGRGAEVVLDFVGEGGTTAQGPAMLAGGGTYFVIGYGGRVELDAIEIISREISVVGSLVGSFSELSELMALAAQGRVRLETRRYGLDDVNTALADLRDGRVHGRGVLVPA